MIEYGDETFSAMAPILLDLDGRPVVAAARIDQYGNEFWCIDDDLPVTGHAKGRPEFFHPSKAKSADLRNTNNAKKGYRVGYARQTCRLAWNDYTGDQWIIAAGFDPFAQVIHTEQINDL